MRAGLRFYCVLLLATGELLAQSDRASITGIIRDSSGAVVAGAKVTVINAEDGIQAMAFTNAVGVFSLLNLPVGHYHLACSKQGFKKYERSDINLAISQVAEIDAALTVGPGTETVTVTKDAPLLQTQTSS